MYLHHVHNACVFYDPSCLHHVYSSHNDHNDHNNNDHPYGDHHDHHLYRISSFFDQKPHDHRHGHHHHDHHHCRISLFYHLSLLFKQTLIFRTLNNVLKFTVK